MERVGEESVFFVINDSLRDLTFCSLKFCTPFQKNGQSSCDGLSQTVFSGTY